MGKYLDIAKKAKLRQEDTTSSPRALMSEQEAAADYRALYSKVAEAARGDCWQIDPRWLLDHHPERWQQLQELDEKLTTLERTNASEQAYQRLLDQISTILRDVRHLQECEQPNEPPVH